MYLSCIVFLLSGLVCSGQTVTFRVITDAGKPLEKRKVSFSLDGYKNGEPVGRSQIQETDKNGEVTFTIPSPSRDFFFFDVNLGSRYWHCSCSGIPKIQRVVQSGIVQSAASKDSKASFKPKPGQVLVVARKASFMERLLYPLMKD
jgi:hypothetical protein